MNLVNFFIFCVIFFEIWATVPVKNFENKKVGVVRSYYIYLTWTKIPL